MTKEHTPRPTLQALVTHMERSVDLVRRGEHLARQADDNDAELDQLIAQSGYTLAEVTEAMLAK